MTYLGIFGPTKVHCRNIMGIRSLKHRSDMERQVQRAITDQICYYFNDVAHRDVYLFNDTWVNHACYRERKKIWSDSGKEGVCCSLNSNVNGVRAYPFPTFSFIEPPCIDHRLSEKFWRCQYEIVIFPDEILTSEAFFIKLVERHHCYLFEVV